MTKLKVLNVGNALGVVLPKAALTRLRIAKGDILHLSTDADGMHLLSPHQEDLAEEIEMAERGIARYRNAMRALAKK